MRPFGPRSGGTYLGLIERAARLPGGSDPAIPPVELSHFSVNRFQQFDGIGITHRALDNLIFGQAENMTHANAVGDTDHGQTIAQNRTDIATLKAGQVQSPADSRALIRLQAELDYLKAGLDELRGRGSRE